MAGFFKLSEFPKMNRRIGLGLLAGLLTAGCALVPSGGDSDEVREAAEAPEQEAPAAPAEPEFKLPDVALDGELLYLVLLGEVAASRGDRETAAESLMKRRGSLEIRAWPSAPRASPWTPGDSRSPGKPHRCG